MAIKMNDETLEKTLEEVKEEEEEIEKKKKKQEFVTAENYDEHLFNEDIKKEAGIEETIKKLWTRLGNNVIAECPKCGRREPTHTCRTRRCSHCRKSFTVCPEKGKSKIVFCTRELIPYLLQVQSLEVDGKYINIL
jgi:hypothetical protein